MKRHFTACPSCSHPTTKPQKENESFARNAILLLLFLAYGGLNLAAQKISGVVVDPAGKPEEFATIALLRARDSAFVKGAVSDAEGRYEMDNISPGDYFARVSLIGYKTVDSKPIAMQAGPARVETVMLLPRENALGEVTVTAQKPLIEVSADKLVFNVDASPSNTGLNALELLRKSPGVSLDQNENIALKGRQNVIVQVNGKPTPMTGQDLAQFLKGLNSADVESIEIISNPGAKYDAEGNAGIINLRLKKDKKLGANGNVSLGLYQGITPKADASVSINYRDKKVNVFGSASMFRGIWHNTMHLDNRTGDRRFDQRNSMFWHARPNNARLGLDYSPNRRHTFGVLVTGGVFLPDNGASVRTDIGSRSEPRIDSILIAENEGSMLNWNSNFNLNYKFDDGKGNELSIDADYGIFRDSQTILNRNFYRDAQNVETLSAVAFRMNMPRDIDIKTIKADYEHRFSLFKDTKDSKWGAGVKAAHVVTNNTFNFMNVLDDEEQFDLDRSNTFIYREQILAGYANFNTQYRKFSLQAGLRAEHTDAMGDLKAYKPINARNVDTSYLSLFPSVALGYQINKNHQLNLTLRRSIDRPRYQELNPFEFRLDEISFRRGNPFVRPQFTRTIELNWTMLQRVNIGASYAQTRNAFVNISDTELDPVTGKQRFFIQVRNLATRENIGFNLNTPIPIASWWNGNLNLFYNYSINKADYGAGRIVDIRVGGGGFWSQHTFTLSKTLSAEASGWFNWGGVWGAYVNRPQGVMDIGLSKRLWDGAGTVRFSFSDVWRTARWSAFTELGSLYIDAGGTWEGRQFKANFTYRFGNKNVANARRRTTGLEEESRRANDGGGGGGRN